MNFQLRRRIGLALLKLAFGLIEFCTLLLDGVAGFANRLAHRSQGSFLLFGIGDIFVVVLLRDLLLLHEFGIAFEIVLRLDGGGFLCQHFLGGLIAIPGPRRQRLPGRPPRFRLRSGFG